jgi:hypothetical protein
MTDGCDDGYTVDLRFFDVTDNLQWPGNTADAYTLNYDNTYTYNLSCNTGDKICYGASDPNGYWGVGVGNTENCPDCCYTCENASESIELVCTTPDTDRAKLSPGTQRVRQIPLPTAYLLPAPAQGPNPAGTIAALRPLTIPVHGVAPCGKGNPLGVDGVRYHFTMGAAFALWGTLPLNAGPTWLGDGE